MRRSVAVLCAVAVVFGGGVWAVAAAGSTSGDPSQLTPLTSGIVRHPFLRGGSGSRI